VVQEVGEVAGGGLWVGESRRVEGGAVQPAVDAPGERELVGGGAGGQGFGDGQRQVRGQPGQPGQVLLDLAGVACGTGQAYRQFVADAEGRVVGAGGGHVADRVVRPLGELVGEQPPDQGGVDVDLVVVAFADLGVRHGR
jgi:hypothetical protein